MALTQAELHDRLVRKISELEQKIQDAYYTGLNPNVVEAVEIWGELSRELLDGRRDWDEVPSAELRVAIAALQTVLADFDL